MNEIHNSSKLTRVLLFTKSAMNYKSIFPPYIIGKISTARFHLRATERYVWKDIRRGIERGRQAVAEAVAVIEHLSSQNYSASQAALLKTLAAAEQSVLSTPFPTPPYRVREELSEGLRRKADYLRSITAIIQEAESMTVDSYMPWRIGQWARLPDGNIGILIARFGFSGDFFIPSIAEERPDDSRRGWALHLGLLEPVKASLSMRLKSPGYYWLAEAKRRWRWSKQLATLKKPSAYRLYGSLTSIIDAAAKAWLIEFAPADRQVIWSYDYAERNLSSLQRHAPEGIVAPFSEGLQLSEGLYREAIQRSGTLPLDWKHRSGLVLGVTKHGLRGLSSSLKRK